VAIQKFSAGDIKGFVPSIDPAQTQEIFALNGKNFLFDTKGPKSYFGNRILLPQARAKPEYVQGIRLKLKLGDRCFTFDGDGIWEWNENLGGWNAIYITPDTTLAPNRWTWGFLADQVYFCHPAVGILVYDLDQNICVPHSTIGTGTPNEAIALTVNNGRLCVAGSQFFYWSAPSDGLDFAPRLGGGGFQLLSDRVSGRPITISSYSGGCLTWTSGGVLRSEFTGDGPVFRHRSLDTEYRPVNSFCVARVDDDTTIILDERGLFQSRGGNITPFAPVFNEFLLGYIQQNNLKVGENLRIEWDELQRFLYVSVSLSYANPLYETCFVLYPPLDKWGQFNEAHYGILPILIQNSERADDYYGFVDSDGRVRYWLGTGSKQKRPEDSNLDDTNLFYPTIQLTPQYREGDHGRILSSTGTATTYDKGEFSQIAGYYQVGAETPVVPEVIGLEAMVQLGMFRPLGPDSSDQLTEIVNVLIRNIEINPENEVVPGFSLTPADSENSFNYIYDDDSEDFLAESQNYINHKLRLISSMDGVSEYQSTEPKLVAFAKGARYYSCSIVGAWHIIEIRADDVGEFFHVQTCEITATNAGRAL
jgi:hypothetical protein